MRYATPGGIAVTRSSSKIAYKHGLKAVLRQLDSYRGIYLSSGYEYPERYSRWDIAAICPPIEIVSLGRDVSFRALNQRGEIIIRILQPLGNNAPFIGLLGTVLGVIKAFYNLGLMGDTGTEFVMKSISTALLATAAGLFVAIPVVMANNYFSKNTKIIIHNMEILTMEFMASMAHKKSLE